jgi:carboxyl-terminal processing protease
MPNKFGKTFVLIFCFLVIFGVGFWVGGNQVACKVCPPEKVDFSLLWEAWDKLQEKFVSPEKLDTQKMIYGAISGMVKSLDDPHTVFFSPEDTKKFMEDVSGRFEGIGAEIGERKGQIQIIAPLEGTPAQKAGLRAGDKIIKINETLTTDLSVDEAVDLIRGPKGTEVTLSIFREGWNSPKEIKIKRAIIEVPSIKWELKDSDIAYIKLSQFSQNADTDFQNAAIEIIRSPAKKIILDLRNNPGGYLEISKEIGGWFLEKNQTVVIEDFQKSGDKKYYNAEGNSKLLTYPIVVLINKGSASASEILAAALRDNRGVKLIGETSYGKGSVQELEKLRGGSTIKITVAKWLTPKGNLIDGVGLEPDIKVEMTDKDYDEDKDPQLDKALEMIKEIK